jgi:hypothetical protein
LKSNQTLWPDALVRPARFELPIDASSKSPRFENQVSARANTRHAAFPNLSAKIQLPCLGHNKKPSGIERLDDQIRAKPYGSLRALAPGDPCIDDATSGRALEALDFNLRRAPRRMLHQPAVTKWNTI